MGVPLAYSGDFTSDFGSVAFPPLGFIAGFAILRASDDPGGTIQFFSTGIEDPGNLGSEITDAAIYAVTPIITIADIAANALLSGYVALPTPAPFTNRESPQQRRVWFHKNGGLATFTLVVHGFSAEQ